jgi:hypothetical protein
MKPFYFQDGEISYTVLVYKSLHEDDDYLVVIREEKYRNHYMRICCQSAEYAATEAYRRHKEVEKYKKIADDRT